MHTHRRDHLPLIADALCRIDRGRAQVDEATRRVTVGVDGTGEHLMAALRSLDAAGVEIEDVALRQPTLDEVFLALTGRPADDSAETETTAA